MKELNQGEAHKVNGGSCECLCVGLSRPNSQIVKNLTECKEMCKTLGAMAPYGKCI